MSEPSEQWIIVSEISDDWAVHRLVCDRRPKPLQLPSLVFNFPILPLISLNVKNHMIYINLNHVLILFDLMNINYSYNSQYLYLHWLW